MYQCFMFLCQRPTLYKFLCHAAPGTEMSLTPLLQNDRENTKQVFKWCGKAYDHWYMVATKSFSESVN